MKAIPDRPAAGRPGRRTRRRPSAALAAALAAVALAATACAGAGFGRRWDPDSPVVPIRAAAGPAGAEAAPPPAESEPPPEARLRNVVVLLPDEAGRVGAIEVITPRGSWTLDRAWQALDFDHPDRPLEAGADRLALAGAAALAVEPPAPAGFVVYFDLGETRPTAESEAGWPAIAAAVTARPAPEVRLTGHADRVGSEAWNATLARRRAETIRDRLVAAGVEPGWIEIASWGETKPAVPTPDGVPEPRNRRVEIRVR